MILYLLILSSYLLGSVNCAVLTCKLMRLPSPYTVGSGNPGATNVKRIGGIKPAAVTLLGDALKGFIPVFAGQLLGVSSSGLAIIALAAVVGHIFPLFYRFRGGKGIATLIGALMALSPPLALVFLATWIIIAKIFRISSLAALCATALMPAFAWLLTNHDYLAALIVIAILIIIRHKDNIKRLLTGQET